MDLASEIRGKMRVGLASGILIGISFLVMEIIYQLNIENLSWIIGFAIFMGAYFLYVSEARKIPRIVAEAEKAKEVQRQERERVKCQCRYEYEGKTLPHKCPQCGKPLRT